MDASAVSFSFSINKIRKKQKQNRGKSKKNCGRYGRARPFQPCKLYLLS